MNEDPFLRTVIEAVFSAVDPVRLRRELSRAMPSEARSAPQPKVADVAAKANLLERIVLTDILDDSILGARPHDEPFPLRLLLSRLGERLDDDDAFAFANALNLFFRVSMDDEMKMRVGLQVSALYYRFAPQSGLEAHEVARVSPLLATLMSSELPRLRFESIDHQTVFDSTIHERSEGSSPSASAIRPVTFLCRVATSNAVRVRAMVRT